jgi:DNA-binding protein H-NS
VAKSLSRIQSQIQKLQKEAEGIRSTVVARIRKEMAQHGLTAEDLFGDARSTFVGNGKLAKSKSKGKTQADKPPKFADGSGNTWGGMGKRPAWIREALEAGRSLEEFLVRAAPKPTQANKAATPARRKVATVAKKSAAAKTATPARKPAAKEAPPKKARPKKTAAKRPARKKAAAPAAASTAKS